MNTKPLYQELIQEILITNKVRRMNFKGNSNFAKKYDHVDVDYKNHSIRVFDRGTNLSWLTFYFSFTLDYARLIDMIETDLFKLSHGLETQDFDFEINK
jgi:hypothetical protein